MQTEIVSYKEVFKQIRDLHNLNRQIAPNEKGVCEVVKFKNLKELIKIARKIK